ncbi:MAG: ComEC/Rec2 family competence protein [Parcubacteria group bacterium]
MNKDTFLRNWRVLLLASLIVVNVSIWVSVQASSERGELEVSFLDVGQGDAVLIESSGGGRLLVDGGPNRNVLAELGRALPFGDRRIDVVIGTHPDTDHIGGLSDVVSRYDVGVFIEAGVESDNTASRALHVALTDKGVPVLLARRGMVIDFGDGAKLTILFPNQDVSKWDPNDASVVARLDYGEDSFLLTGDIEMRTESILIAIDSGELDTDVLKVGHHGSKTSSSQSFLEVVSPEYSVISAGKDNRYGHPHKEVLGRLEAIGSEIFSTAESGTIVFKTNGKTLELK